MKKTLVLASLLAAFGAASAQSSVTVYGQVQVGLFKSTVSNVAVNAPIRIDANNGDNRFGVRGTEALGGGLNATFDLQHRFSPESGSNDGSANGRAFWQGKSTVGLQGGFGKVEMGRQLTAFQGPVGGQDPFGVTTAGSVHVLNGYSTDTAAVNARFDNGGLGRTDVINYTTPNFSGVTASLGYGPKRSNASGAGITNLNDLTSLWVGYSAGPLVAGFGSEKNRQGDKIVAALATYNLGVAKVFAGVQNTDALAVAGAKEKAMNIGVTAPFGPVLVKAGLKTSKAEGTAAKTNKIGLGADYNFSPRTYLSANFGSSKAKATGVTSKGFDMFLQHSF